MKLRYVGTQVKAFPLGEYQPGQVFEIPDWLESAYLPRADIERVDADEAPGWDTPVLRRRASKLSAAESVSNGLADTVEADSHGTEEQAAEGASDASVDVPDDNGAVRELDVPDAR